MAEPFGRGSRSSSIRYQSGGSSCTSNKKRLGSSRLERVVKRQPPPIKEKSYPIKAGTDKEQGSETGSSKESPPSPPTSKRSSQFKTCRGRRRTRSSITQTASISSSTTSATLSWPPSISPKHRVATRSKPTLISKIRHTATAAVSSTTIQEKILLPIFFIFNSSRARPRICKKNGREPSPSSNIQQNISDEREYQLSMENVAASKTAAAAAAIEVQNMQQQMAENPNCSSGFLPPSLDSDAIADTIKTFFPMGASTETSSPTIQFQNYPPDLLSRTSSQSQDLRLSLQSFQEPILLQHQAHHHGHQAQNEHQVLFSGTTAHYLGLDGSSSGWSEQHHTPEINRFQRNLVAWNAAGGGVGVGGGGGFFFNTPLPPLQTMSPSPPIQPFFGPNQFFSQRGPLQSSYTPSVRAWIDPAITPDHHEQQQIPQIYHQQTAISGIGFTASGGEFYGFRHEFKAKMRSTTAFTTSRPLLPLILAIDRAKTSKISPLPGLVHSLRETNTVLRRYLKDWPGDLKMNQWQIPWEEREI
ncbi:LOW QUALITY PROTEIN: hypothetical protein NC652_003891 [Populus alba x Populus x berolinensis]|nr:LOW QUALITY PROTEIN: hypothetical protein NC652_003891 [Populus alba x Populus x berolinensis]